jgi:hypothetical protein
MVRIAKKDTYAMEDVGGGVEVRRMVFAGQRVPETFDVEAGDVEEIEESPSGLRFREAIENPVTLDEGDPEPSDEEPDKVTIPDGDPGGEELAAAAEQAEEEGQAPSPHVRAARGHPAARKKAD